MLAAAGIATAGLGQAGWLGLMAAADGGHGWLPLLAQTAFTLVLAAAVAWQLQRSMRPLQASLQLLQQQAEALEQGRYVVVEDPPLADAVPLARSLNAAVRRAQSGSEPRAQPLLERLRPQRAGDAGPVAEGASRRDLLDAMRAGRWQLAEFAVCDSQGQLLHLECPMRLQLVADGVWEPAERWLAAAAHFRLMTQIDLAALELALAACAADGRARCVHVAAESLSTAGFISAVRSRLESAPQAAACLSIEVAEVSLERLPPQLRNAGTVWRRCGVRLGIEHAGAALRSLLRAGELDIDYVKLRASLVQGLAGDPSRRKQAAGLVALMHERGAQVIAEGADDAADLALLWDLGFDGVTGKAVVAGRESSLKPDVQAMSPA